MLSQVLMIGLYMWIAFYPVTVMSIFLFLLGIQLAIAVSDLVVDAATASLAKEHPTKASEPCRLERRRVLCYVAGPTRTSRAQSGLHMPPEGSPRAS